MPETAAFGEWKAKDAIEWFHGIGRLVPNLRSPCAADIQDPSPAQQHIGSGLNRPIPYRVCVISPEVIDIILPKLSPGRKSI